MEADNNSRSRNGGRNSTETAENEYFDQNGSNHQVQAAETTLNGNDDAGNVARIPAVMTSGVGSPSHISGTNSELIIDISQNSLQAESASEVSPKSNERNLASDGLIKDRKKYLEVCLSLHKAALRGECKEAEKLLGQYKGWELERAAITENYETALHIAAGAKQTSFVKMLLQNYMSQPSDFLLQDQDGNTAFHCAVAAGITQVAEDILDKYESLLELREGQSQIHQTSLPHIRGGNGMFPIHVAASSGHEDMTNFLYSGYYWPTQMNSEDVIKLFLACLETDLYGLAFFLLLFCPHQCCDGREIDVMELAIARVESTGKTALHVLAQKPSTVAPPKKKPSTAFGRDRFYRDIVELLWEELKKRDDLKTIIREPTHVLLDAAVSGNYSLLKTLIQDYPNLARECNEEHQTIFHMAVLHRHKNIFSLIYQLGSIMDVITTYTDSEGNNLWHLAAKLPHQSHLDEVAGAALQLQQELLWFKEVEKIMKPSHISMKNKDGNTPWELFFNEHQDLRQAGEEWMKKTAESCIIVATLVATVVFAAAYSIPGGNYESSDAKNKGTPIHLKTVAFQVFVISDAIALASSTISIFMFLSIIVSPHSMADFSKRLINKLTFELGCLFLSLISALVAFSATFFLAYRHEPSKLVPSIVFAIVFVPVFVYIKLQSHLLDIFWVSSIRSNCLLLWLALRKCMSSIWRKVRPARGNIEGYLS